MTYILARNAQHAHQIANRFGLAQGQWAYVDAPARLEGALRPCVIQPDDWVLGRRDVKAINEKLYEAHADVWHL